MEQEDLMQDLAIPPRRHLAPFGALSTLPSLRLPWHRPRRSTSMTTGNSLLRIADTLMDAAGAAYGCGNVADVIHGCAVELRNLAAAEPFEDTAWHLSPILSVPLADAAKPSHPRAHHALDRAVAGKPAVAGRCPSGRRPDWAGLGFAGDDRERYCSQAGFDGPGVFPVGLRDNEAG